MSQVVDGSDGFTSDYLRDLNTRGPASANVPRSSVVSHQVRYQSPVVQTEARTNDTPMYTEDDARGAYVAPASGYRAPAGGGWNVNSSDTNLRFSNESGGKQYRVSRTQAAKKTAKKTVKKTVKNTVKKQAQNYGSYKDQSDPLSQHILANGSSEQKPPVESVASGVRDVTDQSDMYRAIGRLSSPPSANASQSEVRTAGGINPAGAGSASVPETDFNRGLMGGVGRQVESMRAPDSEQTAPESSSIEDQFKNMPWYEDAKAHHEAVKKNMDDYGSALGTLKSTWDDIPWWTKLVMLPPVFKAGSPAAGASTTGNVWAEGSRAAAGDATAGTKAFEEALSRMNGGAVRGAPVEGTARRSFSSAAEGRRLYGPVAERLLAPKGPLTGGARTTLTSADEGLPVGYSILRSPKIDTSPLAGQTSSLVEQLRAAGIPEDQIAASIARINAGAAGREAAAAAGREAVAAGEQAAGREAVAAGEQAAGAGRAGEAAADGSVSELANAGNAGRSSADEAMEVADRLDELVRSIESGTVDEMGKAWIEGLANQKAAGFESETINYILDLARAAGIIK